MKKESSLVFYSIITVILAVMMVFLYPFFSSFFTNGDLLKLFKNTTNGLSDSFSRTLVFALLTSIGCTLGGLLLALIFSHIKLSSKKGKMLSWLIFPMTLGNFTIAYIFKIAFSHTSFFDFIILKGNLTQLSTLLLIQFWQYGFLFTYLFWINIQNIPEKLNEYSSIIQHTRIEKVRDIILPGVKNLFILLFFICFVFSFYEDAKNYFIFKASQGGKTELISQALRRIYVSIRNISFVDADQTILNTGFIVFVITFFVLFILGLILFKVFRNIFRTKCLAIIRQNYSFKNISLIAWGVCLFLILIPILITLFKSSFGFSTDVFSRLELTFLLTIIASVCATICAILFGISSRMIFNRWLNNFNLKSLCYFLSVFLLQLIPSLCLIICGFSWLSIIGYAHEFLIYLIWIIGHCILVFPLLGCFVLVTHFSIKEGEISYLISHKTGKWGIIKYSFMKRFPAEYLLTFLFAFIFIWNDTSLNMILSDYIYPYAKKLEMSFTGRGASYSNATFLLILSLLLSAICIFIWQSILNKSIKDKNK